LKVSAILLAKVLAYVETVDLSPFGKVFFPELAKSAVERYGFQRYPVKPDQFDESKGIEFGDGKLEDIVIYKFTVFNSLLTVETRSNTDDSKRILEDVLQWAATKFGVNYTSDMVKRYAYISALSFFSEIPILDVSTALTNLSSRTSSALSDIWKEPVRFEPLTLSCGHDPTARKYPIASFTIARRAEARFSENKYFSEAPLPTDLHIRLLKEFETEVQLSKARS
jgi:hypothetical protein